MTVTSKYLALFIGLIAILIFQPGCSSEDQDLIDEELISEYITENNLSPDTTSSGVYYIIKKAGNNTKPNLGNTLICHYEGKYLDGVKFDSSYDRGMEASFPLSGVIQGWQIGLPLIGEGGEIELIIPSRFAYGSSPPAGIRKNAVLYFRVELFDVQ